MKKVYRNSIISSILMYWLIAYILWDANWLIKIDEWRGIDRFLLFVMLIIEKIIIIAFSHSSLFDDDEQEKN